jgi:pimeloyl-ACP methyl ester carboxylesterase
LVSVFCGGVGTLGCGSAPLPSAGTDARLAATDQNVSFSSEGLTLVGTLTLPARRASERVPGVVLIAGSGPESRDEVLDGQLGMSFGFQLPVFELLARALADAGFAVLRYDKRSCGPFNGCADNGYPLPSDAITVDDFIADASAAIDFLDGVEAVDPTLTSVIGHSEGAAFVPTLVSERSDLRSGVMLASPYRPIDALLTQQVDFLAQLLAEQGVDADTVTRELDPLRQELDALAQIRAGDYQGGSVGGAYPPYWTSLMALGDANPDTSASLDRPLLAVGGSYDWNVPLSELSLWQANFMNSPYADERVVVALDCMTHALNCISEPDYRQITMADLGHTLESDLVPTVTTFLRAH